MLKLAAFDFDGTIADSVEMCLLTFELIFQKTLGKDAPSREELYRQFGMNEPGILLRYIGDRVPSREVIADFFAMHEKLHHEMCPEPVPGVKALLLDLKKRGVHVTLLTGRDETSAQISMRVLKLTGIFERFHYGAPSRINKAAQMRELLQQYQLAPEEMVYVGDAVSDVTASREAGVRCLSAAWASSARIAELEKVNPGLVFRTVAEMQEYFLKARG